MYTKYLIFLLALLIWVRSSDESDHEEFVVVSTTPRSPYISNLVEKIDNLHQPLVPPKHNRFPQNCKEALDQGSNVSTFYFVRPELSPRPFLVLCDMQTRGGGWTYVVNRFSGSQNFDLLWTDYKRGFGNIGAEFWLGLDNLYHLTGQQVHEVLIELEDWDFKKVYAFYNFFSVGREDEGYMLKLLGGYEGTAGDSLSYSAGSKFSTRDQFQDDFSHNCANYKGAGWWYRDCTDTLLTGKYFLRNEATNLDGIYWLAFRGPDYSLKQARMMIRPRRTNSMSPQENMNT
ncbi:hypothetical protein Zmor_008303 [Zophobas morio]|uniref:Fibrinogen C-terminal domain-containing protein n=1 Tax=Zophobas morio TaxID=2755281 RepID=A0AA38IW78_9CUCU|nr:hypothetical protein Zmor_008303 [Zophobas morio]